MKRFVEPALWIAVVVALAGAVTAEGKKRHDLEQRVPLGARELYHKLATSQVKLQLVDVRADVAEEYEDAHVPGALPFPGCDLEKTPAAARERILPSVPTVVVTATGAGAELSRCAAFFTTMRNLAGGMSAWSDENLPEDSGEYTAPKPSAGGGCL